MNRTIYLRARKWVLLKLKTQLREVQKINYHFLGRIPSQLINSNQTNLTWQKICTKLFTFWHKKMNSLSWDCSKTTNLRPTSILKKIRKNCYYKNQLTAYGCASTKHGNLLLSITSFQWEFHHKNHQQQQLNLVFRIMKVIFFKFRKSTMASNPWKESCLGSWRIH